MILLMLGFVAALLALEGKGIHAEAFLMTYFIGFLGETSQALSDSTQQQGPSLSQVWFCAFTLIVAVVMVNILIGVLSESYDVHQDNAILIFNRSQAELVLNITLRLCTRQPYMQHWPK